MLKLLVFAACFFPELYPGQELRVGRVVGVFLVTGMGFSQLAELVTVPSLVKL